MRTASLVAIGAFLVGMLLALNVGAFEVGENRLLDSGFEVGSVDELAEQWTLEDGT